MCRVLLCSAKMKAKVVCDFRMGVFVGFICLHYIAEECDVENYINEHMLVINVTSLVTVSCCKMGILHSIFAINSTTQSTA